MKVPRQYQSEGKEQIYDCFRRGIQAILLWLQTGGGKSVMFTDIIMDHYRMGIFVVLVVKRRELIKQASAHLDSAGIPHGIYMAGHRRFRPTELVQICSIDTLNARSLFPHCHEERVLLVIDEAHDCHPKSTGYKNFFLRYPQAYKIGFTATPFNDNSFWEEIICPIQAHELRDQGFLVPERTYVPHVIDVSNVTIKRTGDYNERELFEAASSSQVVGDFVRDWLLYSQQRPTILFAVNVEHSQLVCKAFNDAGIPSIHCDAKTSTSERDAAFRRLASGEVKILCNVNIISTGVDIPPVACIQHCRPTQSLIWHLQSTGRGLRTFSGKSDCIVIDNAGNTLRHGSVYMPRTAKIGRPEKGRKEVGDEVNIRACKQCFLVFESHIKQCPGCGFINPPVVRSIRQIDGDLVEYQMTDEERKLMQTRMIFNDFHQLCWVAVRRNLHWNWVYQTLDKKYGLEAMAEHRGKLIVPDKLIAMKAGSEKKSGWGNQ